MQYRGRSVPGWPEYEMPEEECGEAAGAGMLGWGPLGWGQRGWRLGFLVRVARGPEGFKLGLYSWMVQGQGPRTLQKL